MREIELTEHPMGKRHESSGDRESMGSEYDQYGLGIFLLFPKALTTVKMESKL